MKLTKKTKSKLHTHHIHIYTNQKAQNQTIINQIKKTK